jgi:hypothetical protein
MSENFPSEVGPEAALNSLLQEGAKSYLDALSALNRYTLEVTNTAVTVLRDQLPALIEAIDRRSTDLLSVDPFVDPQSGNKVCIGRWAWIGARCWCAPWKCWCNLGLAFEKEDGETTIPYVVFMCQSERVGNHNKMKLLFQNGDKEHYYSASNHDRQCGLYWRLKDVLKLQEEFEGMMKHLLVVVTSLEGREGDTA